MAVPAAAAPLLLAPHVATPPFGVIQCLSLILTGFTGRRLCQDSGLHLLQILADLVALPKEILLLLRVVPKLKSLNWELILDLKLKMLKCISNVRQLKNKRPKNILYTIITK